jgi:uncharacterized membrane protein YczE
MDKFHLENRDPLAYIQIMGGLFVFAAGIVFILKSDLGMGPWDVFHVGVTNYLPLTLGRINQVVGLIIIVVSCFLSIYPGVGTVLNMVFIGLFIDIINPYIPFMDGIVFQILFLAAGITLMGTGSGLYINANLGAGPRDSLMLGLSKRTGKSVRLVRNSMELTVLIIGFFLGGPVGLGTVAFALTIGPSVQFFLKIVPERGTRPNKSPAH